MDCSNKRIINVVVVVLSIIFLFIILYDSVYNIGVREQVIITQFGKIIGDAKDKPGLNFKLPLIQKKHYIPRHEVFELKATGLSLMANSGENLILDVKVMWTISGPIKYFNTVNSYNDQAQDYLKNTIMSSLTPFFSSYNIKNIFEENINREFNFKFKPEVFEKIKRLISMKFMDIGIGIMKIEIAIHGIVKQ